MFITAYKFIKYDRAKSIGVLVGIVISIFLIGQQLGTLRYLTSLMGALAYNSNTTERDIWIIDNNTQNLTTLNKIDRRNLQEIRSIPGVIATQAIIVAPSTATFAGGKTVSLNLIGSDGPQFIAGPHVSKIASGKLQDLTQPNAFSAEYYNSKNFGIELSRNQAVEINKKSAIVKVLTKNAQSFGGYLSYTSMANARFYGNFPADKISIVSATLSATANKEQVINQINATFHSVKAWDIEELAQATTREILISSNMGISFGALVIFAVISGFFIIGLTLYSAALDRLVDYGTLKAIGATNAYVSKLILTQALIFAAIGYLLAMLLLLGFKMGVAQSGLIVALDFKLAVLLLTITLFMSLGGSLFALLRIRKLEPASIF